MGARSVTGGTNWSPVGGKPSFVVRAQHRGINIPTVAGFQLAM